jgi:spore germination protein GerM
LRLIINIFLLILIVFSLSIIPINYQTFDINFPHFGNNNSEEEITEKNTIDFFNIETTENNSFLTDNTFTILINSSDKEELQTIIDTFNIKISNPNKAVETIKLKEIKNSYEKNTLDINQYLPEYSDQDIYTIKYNFYLKDLNIKSNYYTTLITSTDTRIKDTISYEFNYTNNNTYIGSSNETPTNKLYTEVYYADENYLRLVPVNASIEQTDRFIRKTMNKLLEIPNEKYGLSNNIVAPLIKRIYISNKIARIDFTSFDIKDFSNGSASATFALNSIINTIGKFDYVDKVKFFVDYTDTSDYFHGTDLSETFIINTLPNAYVGLETSKKTMFLYPIGITETNLNDKIDSIINTLKTTSYKSNATMSLIPTLPNNIKLLNYRFDEKNIELDFSEEFLTVYQENTNYNTLMYESLLYSLTSIEGINTVSIVINGEKVSSFNGLEISNPQKPNAFINTLN